MVRALTLTVVIAAACGGHATQDLGDAGADAADAPADGAGPDAAGTAAFSVTPATLDFGTVQVGMSSVAAQLTFENTGDGSSAPVSVHFGGANATSFELAAVTCAGAIAPGATCSTMVRFSPLTAGALSATVVLTDGSASATATVTGTGVTAPGIRITPSVHDYGAHAVNTTTSTTFTVSNTGGSSTGVLAVTIDGANPGDFTIGTQTCAGAALAAGGTCTASVAFKPAAAGSRAATLHVTGAAGGAATASLVGTGVAVTSSGLSIAPTQHNFGSVQIGSNSFGFMFTVTNTGTQTTGTIATSLSGTNIGDFQVQANQCTGTLAPSATCTLFVTFEPGAVGTRTASISLVATPGGTATAALGGTCTP